MTNERSRVVVQGFGAMGDESSETADRVLLNSVLLFITNGVLRREEIGTSRGCNTSHYIRQYTKTTTISAPHPKMRMISQRTPQKTKTPVT